MNIKYNSLGVMSGSSLDGLDIAFCTIEYNESAQWNYKIQQAETIEYSETWQIRLKELSKQNAEILAKTHLYYGMYCAELIENFIAKNNIEGIEFISFHGHTIFHNPKQNFTLQIGSGAAIAAKTKIDTICDFRSTDIILQGEGAPLAPIVDVLLFKEIRYFLNIGGICNISFNNTENNAENIIGFDVCAGNQILNYLAKFKDMKFDFNGDLAKKGSLQIDLYNDLNKWDFFDKKYPKSLDKADIEPYFIPILNRFNYSIEDKLHTVCTHIAYQISKSLESLNFNKEEKKLLISGGGALNSFLVEKIADYTKFEIIVPDYKTIQFKESLLMSLLGTLRIMNINNCLKSVTGAARNSISGAIYKGI